MNARGIPSVQYTQTNQLEGLRRMQHRRDLKPKATSGVIHNVYINLGPQQADGSHAVNAYVAAHPCEFGRHRPAWLVDGGIACGVCGAYL